MKWLLPIGAVLVAIGMAGSAAACFGTAVFDGQQTETAAQLQGATDAPADTTNDASSPRLFLAPLAGLTLAIGLVCLAIGMNNWRQAGATSRRSANPWSDQPRERDNSTRDSARR